MTMKPQTIQHSVQGHGLADVLERVLDKGLVIAGDIKIKLVDIELLTIQVRLLIASVDKAREMGLDWWMFEPSLASKARASAPAVVALEERLRQLEAQVAAQAPLSP